MGRIFFTVNGDFDRMNAIESSMGYDTNLQHYVFSLGNGPFKTRSGFGPEFFLTGKGTNYIAIFFDALYANFSDNILSVSLNGSFRRDVLIGGVAGDYIAGERGNDVLIGGRSSGDALYGGEGDDRLTITGTPGVVSGGTGTDTLIIEDSPTDSFVVLRNQNFGGDIERLIVTGGAAVNLAGLTSTIPVIRANSAFGTQTGIYGTQADDRIVGGNGFDALAGGAGGDVVTGGAGADIFGFLTFADFGLTKRDRITDFDRAEGDRIALNVLDPDALTAGDQAFTFIGDAAFTGAGGTAFEVRARDDGNGAYTVFLDINQDARADFAFIVHSESGPLIATDFVL